MTKFTGTCIGGPGAGTEQTAILDQLAVELRKTTVDLAGPGAIPKQDQVAITYYRHHLCHWHNDATGVTTLMGLWVPSDKDLPWAVQQMLEGYKEAQGKTRDPSILTEALDEIAQGSRLAPSPMVARDALNRYWRSGK